jgi:hypothetical protein
MVLLGVLLHVVLLDVLCTCPGLAWDHTAAAAAGRSTTTAAIAAASASAAAAAAAAGINENA